MEQSRRTMNLKEQCEEDEITLAEGKEKYGLTHWKQEVKSMDQESIIEDVEPVAIKTESKQAPEVSREYMIGSLRGLGTKSPYWKLKDSLGL